LSNATEWTGFPMRDLCGHEILPPQFPRKLPSIVDSGIGSLSVPMATPRPLTDELMIEIAGKMKKGIQLLSALPKYYQQRNDCWKMISIFIQIARHKL